MQIDLILKSLPSASTTAGIAAAVLGVLYLYNKWSTADPRDAQFKRIPSPSSSEHPGTTTAEARNEKLYWVNIFAGKFLRVLGGEYCKWILVKGEGKFIESAWPSRWKELLGAHGVAFNQTNHRKIRNLLTKGITKSTISFLYPNIVENARKVISILADASEQGHKDVKPLAMARTYTFNAICGFLACADPKHEEILKSLRPDFIIWTQGLIDLFLPRWIPFLPFARGMAARERILKAVGEIVKERKARMEEGVVYEDSLGYIIAAKDEEDGDSLSEDAIGDNFITLAFAGYDTTAGTICSSLHVLLNEIHPDELQLLKDEVLGLEEPISEQTLQSLPALDSFVKEMVRLYAPAPGVFRVMTKDMETADGRVIPAGTKLSLNFISNHQNPDIFEEPAKFRLSRFMVDEVDKKHPLEYTPFGSGPRLCLGMHLARLEIKVFVAELLRNYDIGRGSKPTAFYHVPMWIAEPSVRIRSKKL
ncbi:hypothetical protein HDU97_005850 [Phlyctochytrium planicorne]|nr:hypothetical protein HDU97_005850 [Phlyctochytrium planicorne]